MCQLLGKAFKHDPLTILLSLVGIYSYSLGHATVKVNQVWNEPSLLWMVINIKTGRGKSTLHQVLSDILSDVETQMETISYNEKRGGRKMTDPSGSWFGEILASNGGRLLGLYDELLSFFVAHGIVNVTQKGKISENKEQQELLVMFNGKNKRRYTLTGNANFDIKNTSFSILGFTQPATAFPIIKDTLGNQNGFTNRFIWFFPKPIYSKFEDLTLSPEEAVKFTNHKKSIASSLTNLYHSSDMRCVYEQKDKVLVVKPFVQKFKLSEDAREYYKNVHNEFEFDVAKKYEDDAFISGLYARGKAQIIRLAVAIEVLCTSFIQEQSATNLTNEMEADEEVVVSELLKDMVNEVAEENLCFEDEDDKEISLNSMMIAHEILMITFNQLGHILGRDVKKGTTNNIDPITWKTVKYILLLPGQVISSTVVIAGGKLRSLAPKKVSNRKFLERIYFEIDQVKPGSYENKLSRNNSMVLYLCKVKPEDISEEKLLEYGISLAEYNTSYYCENEDSAKHLSCYQNKRKRNHESTSNDGQDVGETDFDVV